MTRFTRSFLCLLALSLLPWTPRAESLLELYQRTLETNPTLKSQEYSVDLAKAQEDQVFSKLLPQIFAVGSYSYNDLQQQAGKSSLSLAPLPRIDEQYTGLRGTVQLRQALLDLASFFRWQGAASVILQSEQELEAARMAVAVDLVDRYLKALEASDDITYVESEKKATESRLSRLRRMHELQMAKVTDLYEVEAFYRMLQTREIEAGNARAVALEKLRELTGIPVKAVAPLTRESFPPVPKDADEWVREATRDNPGLIALQHALDSADHLVTSSRAEHVPQLALQVSETYADTGYDNRSQPPYNVFTAGVQLTVPIYEGGRVQAGVRDAEARRLIARERFEQKRREIEQGTRTAYLDAVAGYARIDSMGEEVRAQAKSAAAQERGYELGASTIIDLLDTRRRLLKARLDQARARYDYIRGLAALWVRSGSLSETSVRELDSWMAARPANATGVSIGSGAGATGIHRPRPLPSGSTNHSIPASQAGSPGE